jgi:hypothetical protein
MNLKVLVIAICFLSASVFADNDMKRKDISTVDDVKELRALMIKRMNTKLASGDLGKREVKFLENRIALLETKPLPTQEQIDWRKENREAVKSSRGQKGKNNAGMKRKYLQKKRNRKF